MKLRSGKTYSYAQPRESKHSTSIGFFDKAIPIDLRLIPYTDIEKIDMRIKLKRDEQHKSQLIDCVNHFEQTCRIYVSTIGNLGAFKRADDTN